MQRRVDLFVLAYLSSDFPQAAVLLDSPLHLQASAPRSCNVAHDASLPQALSRLACKSQKEVAADVGAYLCAPLPIDVGVLRQRGADGAHAGSTHINLPGCHDAAEAPGAGPGRGVRLSLVCEGARGSIQTAQPGCPGLQKACEYTNVEGHKSQR